MRDVWIADQHMGAAVASPQSEAQFTPVREFRPRRQREFRVANPKTRHAITAGRDLRERLQFVAETGATNHACRDDSGW
jgi:hypothetical protein